MVAARLANISHDGDRKSSGIKTEISELISQPQAAQMLNVSDDAVGMGRKAARNNNLIEMCFLNENDRT